MAERKGYHLSLEELENLLNEFPKDMTECLLDEDSEYIVAEYLSYEGKYEKLRDVQAGKEFYIPYYEEVLDYDENLYLSREPAYVQLRIFFQTEMNLTYEEAYDGAENIWDMISWGEDFRDMVKHILNEYGNRVDERRLKELIYLLQKANNHTRMMIHRGYTPDEMMRKNKSNGHFRQMPVIVPGSTSAANLLQEASPELERIGFEWKYCKFSGFSKQEDLPQ